jgi:hypothetical protein
VAAYRLEPAGAGCPGSDPVEDAENADALAALARYAVHTGTVLPAELVVRIAGTRKTDTDDLWRSG